MLPRLVALRRLLLLLLLACAGMAQATPPDLLDQVLAELGQHHAVRARFTQTRSNPALAVPQVSHGRLLFVVGEGMLWQVETPYAETLAFTRRQSARVDVDGKLHPLRNQRGMAEVSRMLQSLLAGEASEVARQFDLLAQGDAKAWTLRFTPKQERMARVLGSIELSGGEFLGAILIHMHDGAITDIRMEDTRVAGTLSALERHALGSP